MAGYPNITSVPFMAPVACYPYSARTRRHSPITPMVDISAISRCPLFCYPNMCTTWARRPNYNNTTRTRRAYMHINTYLGIALRNGKE